MIKIGKTYYNVYDNGSISAITVVNKNTHGIYLCKVVSIEEGCYSEIQYLPPGHFSDCYPTHKKALKQVAKMLKREMKRTKNFKPKTC